VAFKVKRFILIQVAIFLLSGCSLFGIGGEEPEKPPEELMREGMSAFRDGDYTEAAESFQNLKDRYPYSKLAVQAELKLADAIFKRKEFEEALETYKCSFLRMNTTDRDQTSTKEALKEFERLGREFPTNLFALMAQRRIRRCLINLAEYEFYVGHFYFKTGRYLAALRRFEYLITHYPDYGQYGKTLFYIAKCKEKLSGQKAVH